MKNLFILFLFLVLIIPVKSQNLQIVKEINPNSISYNGFDLNESNGKIFFAASDGNLSHVWVTDGSDEGTFGIQEGYLNRSGEHGPQSIFSFNNKSYFILREVLSQWDRLYESDGTKTGTLKVSDLTLNIIAGVFLDKLFLRKSLYNDQEIWVLNKNEAAPVLIKKIKTNFLFTEYKNKVYFTDTEIGGSDNYELWVSDGTPGGTMKFKEISSAGSSYPNRFLVYNDKLYFLAQSDISKSTADLWRTDGTEQGTIKVGTTNLELREAGTKVYEYKPFILNGKMYFSGIVGKSSETNRMAQVWESDGTDAGTKVFSSDKRAVGILNNQLLMVKDNQKEQLLYITDGNAGNTRQIANLQVTEDLVNTFYVGKIEVLNNRAYILTTMYSTLTYDDYSYLWETDGTAAGTRLITPYKSFYGNPLPNFYYSPVYGNRIAVLNGEVYFPYLADENEGFELYKYSFSPATFAKGIEKAEIGADVYPNPIQDILNISLSERKINSIQLLNLNGQIIDSHNPESSASSYRFSVQNYKSGIYILKIIDDEGVVYNKRVFKK